MSYVRALIPVIPFILASGLIASAQETRPAGTHADNAPTTVPAAAVEISTSATQPAEGPGIDGDGQKLERFIEHARSTWNLSSPARESIDKLVNQREAADDPRALMESALSIHSSQYKRASDALDAGNTSAALQAADELVKDPDFYLSSHARVLAARAMVEEDRPDEARKLLEAPGDQRDELVSRTFIGPEVWFLLGYCHLSNLDYDSAVRTFREFEELFPNAPDQYRLPVRQMMQELAGRRPEGLSDVSDLMGYAGRQLRHARANQVVQARQERAVELLSRLIEDAEQREEQQKQQQQQQAGCKDCGGKGCPKCQGGSAQGNQQPQRGADRSVLPPGQGRTGDLRQSGRARPGEQWGQMRPEEREKVMQALRQNYPSRYRQLVEQYYRQLSRED